MTKHEIISAVRDLPESQQCEIVRELVAEHVQKHGSEIIEKYAKNHAWVKAAWAGLGATLATWLSLSCTSCTVTQNAQGADGATKTFSAQFNPGDIVTAATSILSSAKPQ